MAQSAIDVISPAFDHTKRQLLQPFNFGQWARIALLAMATGEMSSGGGCQSHMPSNFPSAHTQQNFAAGPADILRGIDPALIGTLVMVAVIGFIVLALVWLYVSSISRFVLYETVVRRHCEISPAWDRWHSQGMRFFWWQLGLMLLSLGVAVLTLFPLIIPLVEAVKNRSHLGAGFFLGFLPFLLIFGAFTLVLLLVAVLTKDFVVPIMAIDGVGVMEGWRRLIAMMKAETGQYAGYIGMKIVLAIGAGIVFSILSFIVLVILLIPGAVVGVVAVLAAKASGLTWTVATVTLAVVVGTVLLAALLYVIALICVPVAVFFPAYALYFLADRYPGLRAQLYGAPVSPTPAWTPPLPSAPAPSGI